MSEGHTNIPVTGRGVGGTSTITSSTGFGQSGVSGISREQRERERESGTSNIGATTTQPLHQVSGTRAREQKDPMFEYGEASLQQVKKVGERMYDQACDACHNWRHYPKLLTTVLLLTTFLLGAGTSGVVQRMGWGGGSHHYVSQHWDREAADAHHALDVVIDHLKHPELYRTQHAEGYVQKARRSLSDIFSGMMPSILSSRKVPYGGRDMWEQGRDMGRDVYDKASNVGRDMYEKARGGPSIYDKVSDLGQDISYGARRGMDQVKDATYGIGDKLSDMAQGVKERILPERGYGGESYFGRDQQPSRTGGWLGMGNLFGRRGGEREREREDHPQYVRRGATDEDEFRVADDKLRSVIRKAEREL